MSYGGNADPTGIQVTFLDQTGAKSVKAVIAFSVPVSRILPNIITKMNLPTTSPDGQPMSYSLDHKEGGRRLLESTDPGRGRRPERRPPDRLSRGRRGLARAVAVPSSADPLLVPFRALDRAHARIATDPTPLQNDLAAMERLARESSVLSVPSVGTAGDPAT